MENRIDLILDFYRAAANEGRRCPQTHEQHAAFGSIRKGESPGELAKAGHLTCVEIYGKNWRVIEIDGMRTAPFVPKDGHKAKPYRTIDKGGDNWVTR